MKSLATWIMNRIAGEGSSDWAQAMRCEYDELEEGHFGWAMGSLGAVIARDIRLNWPLFAGVFLTSVLMVPITFLIFALVRSNEALEAFLHAHFYTIFILLPAPFSFLFGYWKPGRALLTAILGGFIGQGVINAIVASLLLGGGFLHWWIDAMWMDTLPFWLGSIVVTAIWFASAWAGGTVRSYRSRAKNA